jgi:hypothetical protein
MCDTDTGKRFYAADSVIIKYKNVAGKYSVTHGIIWKIGTKYLLLRITPVYENHKKTSSWWYSKEIIIKNIDTIKSFKNAIDIESKEAV